MSKPRFFAFCFVACAVAASSMWALAAGSTGAASPPIAYRGYLEKNGQPVSGARDLSFHLWTEAEGGSEVWSETHADVQVNAGRFSVMLGQSSALTPALLEGDRYLEVRVKDGGSFVPLLGRQRLGAAAFALRAAPGADFLVDGSMTVRGDLDVAGKAVGLCERFCTGPCQYCDADGICRGRDDRQRHGCAPEFVCVAGECEEKVKIVLNEITGLDCNTLCQQVGSGRRCVGVGRDERATDGRQELYGCSNASATCSSVMVWTEGGTTCNRMHYGPWTNCRCEF